MKSTIIVSIVLFVAVVAASIFYFTGLGSSQKDISKPLTFLPKETLLIAAFKNEETTDNIFKDYEVFDALLGFQQKERMDNFKKELLRSSVLSEYVTGTDVYVSFHQIGESVELLFTIPTVKALPKDGAANILSQLSTAYQTNTLDTLGEHILSLRSDSNDFTLYAAYHSDIFFVTPSLSILEKVLDKRHPKLSQRQISFFLEHTNRNVPMSFYFTHDHVDSIAQFSQRVRPREFMQQFLKLGGHSTWNINYKQDALMLTGESELANSEKNYIALFANQHKTSQRLYQYFPANTALYLEYSLSDVRRYRQDLEKYLTRKPNQKRIQDQLENLRSSRQQVMRGFEEALGSEFAVVELSNGNYLGFLSLRDSNAIDGLLPEISESAGENLYRFKYEHMLYAYYGDAFQTFQRPYFTIVDDVLVFANQSGTLSDYVRQWHNSDLLIGTLGFKNYDRMQGNEANVTFFLHTKNASRMLANNLITPFARNFRNTKDYGYQDFYSWSVQLTGNGGNFISSLFGMYKSSTALGSSPEWTYSFNNRLITRPYVFEHSDTSQFILAQEQDHTVHAIHPTGKKMWSTVISGRVIGDMTQLHDRSIVLVTDRNRLYRFDNSGNGFPGFSLALPQTPTGTPIVYTISNREVILVPLSDHLAAYDMQGNALSNWKSSPVSGRLLDGIHQSKQYIVVGSTAGHVYFLDHDGNIAHELKTSSEVNFKSALGRISDSNAEDTFITTDTDGIFYRFSLKNGINSTSIPDLSEHHQAYFAPLTVSNAPEMIVIDGNALDVYTTGDSVRSQFSQKFTRDMYSAPLLFPNSRSTVQLGISVPANNLIYLFSENGSIVDGFPIEALPLFYYGPINYNSGNYLLSTKRDHKLYAFKH